MALFKKRSSSSPAESDSTPDSAAAYADPIRRRARHRLIGASVLVGVAVLVLPWIFDVKPPTVSANVPIAIDSQAETPQTPSPQLAQAPVRAADPAPATETPPERNRPADNTPAPAAKPAPAATEPATRAPAQTRQATAPKAAPTPVPSPRKPANIDELIAQRQAQTQAQARENKPSPAPNKPAATNTATKTEPAKQPPVEYNFPEKGRFVVQIGAYVEADKVVNVRNRLKQAGLNNYTQKVSINGQQVTRVRIGPFTSRKQMEQAASKVRALGLPVSLYQL